MSKDRLKRIARLEARQPKGKPWVDCSLWAIRNFWPCSKVGVLPPEVERTVNEAGRAPGYAYRARPHSRSPRSRRSRLFRPSASDRERRLAANRL
jgi:hypothetical protein